MVLNYFIIPIFSSFCEVYHYFSEVRTFWPKPPHFVEMNCYLVSVANKDYVIEIDANSQENGAQLILQKFNGGLHQQFSLYDRSIVCSDSGKVVDFDEEENKLIQVSLEDAKQKWYYTADMTIENEEGKCFDIEGNKIEDGTPIILFEKTGRDNQKWLLVTRRFNKKD